jgi:hypothetical protein
LGEHAHTCGSTTVALNVGVLIFVLQAVSPTATPEELSTKEVVQLKFLQKSNKEQMDKLYELIRYEPLVIHHYLQRNIFPQYMRSQRMKISASGQAVGGDMLVGKRVGFSGTPSDLLPQELGRCDYETGDDGMMLTTCLDRSVTSYEFIQVRITSNHCAYAELLTVTPNLLSVCCRTNGPWSCCWSASQQARAPVTTP